MEKVKTGVIGVGHLGQHHARNYYEIPEAELVGICDLNRERGEEIAAKFQTQYYGNVDELLHACDAVNIAADTSVHFELAQKAIQMGKHVLVEKPITATVEQAKQLVDLARQHNVKLQVGHIERFNSAIRALEPHLQTPLFIEVHRLAPFTPRGADVAVVLDLMIHDIDIILSLVQSEVTHIRASGVPVISPTVDIANARVEFANGCVANVTASRVSQERVRKIRFFQGNQYISLDYQKQEIQMIEKASNWMEILATSPKPDFEKLIVSQTIQPEKEEPLKLELSAFLDAIINDKRPVVNGEDGYKALKVAGEILQKIEERMQLLKK